MKTRGEVALSGRCSASFILAGQVRGGGGDGPCPQRSPGNLESHEPVSRRAWADERGLTGPKSTVGICDQLALEEDSASGFLSLPAKRAGRAGWGLGRGRH